MDETGKKPYEKFTVDVDFSEAMAEVEGSYIISQTVTVTDNAENDVSSTMIEAGTVGNKDSTHVTALIQGGEEAYSPYLINVKCVTSVGHRWEHDIKLRVKNKP